MEKQNARVMVAAALGAVGGLLLGLYLWGDEDKKGKLSNHLSNLSEIVKELEEVGTEEAKSMKEKVSKLMKSVEKVMKDTDG